MSVKIQKIQYGYDGEYGWVCRPDSAGGVGVLLTLKNLDSKRTIKYLTIEITPYNAVGDIVEDEISEVSTKQLRYTGPLGPNKTCKNIMWEDVWYNYSIRKISIEVIEIEYTNGTIETQIVNPNYYDNNYDESNDEFDIQIDLYCKMVR